MGNSSVDHSRAGFSSIEQGTADDWAIIGNDFMRFSKSLPDRVLDRLRVLDTDFGGFPIDRVQHSLQTATRAHRAGEEEEYIVCALLHDIGDALGTFNHPDIAAAILKPFVSEANHWMVERHAIFQGYYFFHYLGLDRDMRDRFQGHPHYERTRLFCEKYDSPSFDSHFDTMPLEAFEPMVRRLFAAPKHSVYGSAKVPDRS